jgi:DNA polymerase V
LAKLANHIGKTAERKPGSYPVRFAQVCNLTSLSPSELKETFSATAVGEVWGIGRRISKQLEEGGIRSVQDLVEVDAATVRRGWSVVLERTVRELQGTPCIDLDDTPAAKKEIACTRSFGRPVMELNFLREAVTEFASRAAEKMRKQHSLASQVLVFVRTSPFRPDAQYSRSLIVPLRRPTADTSLIANGALLGLDAIYRSGFKYAKAGVILVDLQPDSVQQQELDLEDDCESDKTRLMSALDTINQRYGKGTMKIASAGLDGDRRVWSMRQERRTPGYTTCVADMPVARA